MRARACVCVHVCVFNYYFTEQFIHHGLINLEKHVNTSVSVTSCNSITLSVCSRGLIIRRYDTS